MKIFAAITDLINYAQRKLALNPLNVNYVRNNILDLLSLRTYEYAEGSRSNDVQVLLDGFTRAAVDDGVFSESDAAYYCDKVMAALSLTPAETDTEFKKIYETKGAKRATDWFYDYCVSNNYVKKAVLDKNPRFEREGLVITVNLAKPEFRDPSKAKSGNSVEGGYPSCVICRENEGYIPRGKGMLRTVSLKLNNQNWFWQYSPYGYFNEHGIAVNAEHIPMRVDKLTFLNLMEFTDIFPHYFIGCNAALERIGGSVLSHDHYQGGREVLPLHKAEISRFFTYNDYEDVNVGIVDWDGSVVRVISQNKQRLAEVCDVIRNAWINYDNDELNIVSGKDGIKFSEVSPTVYKRGGVYVMNIILRNNGVSAEYPDGIFHAHPEFHSIKKESIGLIEAQGLFILPGRLNKQLGKITTALENGSGLPAELTDFKNIYAEAKRLTEKGMCAEEAVKTELADVCRRILRNTAVFKSQDDFEKFLISSGFKPANYEYKISAGGRVNVIGEHIDYCGGKVLPASLSLKNTVYAKNNGTNEIHIRWTTLPYTVSLKIDSLSNYRHLPYANYIAGCALALQQSGVKISGCDLLYDCSVPFGSGLSSSAAIEVSTLAALKTLAGVEIDLKQTALCAQSAEREYANVNCGIMDQYASAFGRKDTALLLDCKNVSHEYIPLNLGEYKLMVVNTNKPHSLTQSKYNERREETEKGLACLQKTLKVDCLADVTPQEFEVNKSLLIGKISDRVEHVVYECARVNEAKEAMLNGDLQRLGLLLNESHKSLKEKYEVSCAELDTLAETAQLHRSCLGARMTGAGFGGSIVALVKKDSVLDFEKFVGGVYRDKIGYDADFYEADVTDSIKVTDLRKIS